MRILIFSPYPLTGVSGNAVTLRRIQRNLTRRGHKVEVVIPASEERVDLLEEAIDTFAPDVLHWYHAYRTGRFLLRVRQAKDTPSVVTVSGTDLNVHCEDPERRGEVLRVLQRSRMVLAASASMAERAVSLFPEIKAKVRRITKGVSVGYAPFDIGVEDSEKLVFLPGGLRPVKNQLFVFDALKGTPEFRLLLAGPPVDAEYAHKVLDEVARSPWAKHIDLIPHEAMGSVYRRASVVLNTSVSEGLANSVLEAMACGAVVLASDIPGNRNAVEDGVTGFLYDGAASFREKLMSALENPGSIGRAASDSVSERFSPIQEADDLARVYAEAVV